jgi:amino acid adenylation domain-containing protein
MSQPSDQLLHRLFFAQAERTPDRAAVVWGEERVTYAELADRAAGLAAALCALGVGPEVPVGICARRTPDLLASLLGILAAGGAYLPLDPRYPRERLAFMLEDSGAPVVLADEASFSALPETGARRLILGSLGREEGRTVPPLEPGADNLAYLIYTSGSTGRPKGVAIPHRAAVHLMEWARGVFAPEELSGVLAATSVCFDLSVFEIFVPLSWGGRVILADDALALPDLAAAGEVTLVNTVPSAATELVRAGGFPASVRTINLAGEALQRVLVDQLYERTAARAVYNLYGPSEDTTYSTGTLVPRGISEPPTIGVPLPGETARVLGPDWREAADGEEGELFLGGPALARGYLARPDLTAERFLPDPRSEEPGARLYRTGDLVRRRPDGELDFLGRLDHQVKIRGFRIELGEIEAALLAIPGVRQSVMVAQKGAGGARLVAYLAPESPETPDAEGLRRQLAGHLPEHMLPAVFVHLPTLPLTPNGKVDRKALPEPPAAVEGRGEPAAPPRNETEARLATLFAEALELEPGAVGIHDSFYALGGNSLLATRLVWRLRDEIGAEVTLRDLLTAPTVERLAALLQEERRTAAPAWPPLELVPRDRPLPLSSPQLRLWLIHLREPSCLYNVPLAAELNGPLDTAALRRALDEIVRRHEPLRTTYRLAGGIPVQVIAPPAGSGLIEIDLAHLPAGETEAVAAETAWREGRQVFDLESGPVLRAVLLRLEEESHRLLLTVHHIAWDDGAARVFLDDLTALYPAFAAGRPSPLPEPGAQYADFAVWQQRWIEAGGADRLLDYWLGRLRGIEPLDLPADRPRPARPSLAGGRRRVRAGEDLTARLRALAAREGVTLTTLLLALDQVWAFRLTGRERFVLGMPAAARPLPETGEMIGFFSSNLLLRADLSAELPLQEVIARARETLLDALDHQHVPFDRLAEAAIAARLSGIEGPGLDGLMRVGMTLFRWPGKALDLAPGVHFGWHELDNGTAKSDFALYVEEEERDLVIEAEHSADLFDPTTVDRLLTLLVRLAAAAVADPGRPISSFGWLDEAERAELAAWNDTRSDFPRDACLHELFAAVAARAPEAVALEHGDLLLTCGELDRRSDLLAGRLRALGVGPEVVVGLLFERTPELLVALLGTLKAGGVYLPLDPSNPAERLALMLEDAQAPVLLTVAALAGRRPETKELVQVLEIDRLEPVEEAEPLRPVFRPVFQSLPENPAAIFFTSGSTGRPKGVVVPHRGIVRLVLGVDYLHLGADDRGSFASNISFDSSSLEIWGTLLHGGRMVTVERNVLLSPERFEQVLLERGITWAPLTAALFHQMVAERPAMFRTLRTLTLGGEAPDPRRVREALAAGAPGRLLNCYGPTESTTIAAAFRIEAVADGATALPMGRPIANTTAWVVDRCFQAVPAGLEGEIWLGGDGLARGYLGRPDLTAERFVPDPFSGAPGGRLYRTGDLGRWRPESGLEFLGRTDDQVKIRGFRIEPGEIEATLHTLPGVGHAVVLVREEAGDRRLVAYVDKAEGAVLEAASLRQALARTLPAHMIPAAFVFLERLPLLPTGKVDRKALARIAPEAPRPSHQDTSAAPRTATEQRVAALWQELLGLERVGVEESFFDLGGHSLLLMRLHARLRDDFGADLPLTELFRLPDVRSLARRLDGGVEERPDAGRQRSRRESGEIAIIGMAGRFPGAASVEELWGNLCAGREAFTVFGDEELRAAGVPEELIARPDYVRVRGVLPGVELFDAPFFDIPPREAEVLDPQQRIFLECAWEALESAGYDPRRLGRQEVPVGVFAGASFASYLVRHVLARPEILAAVGEDQAMLGSAGDFLAARVSYKLDLSGPSLAVQTACSTSLVAVHLACQSILAGECDMALAGGVSVRLPQVSGQLWQEGGTLSRDGHVRAFDAEASGTVSGSGAGVVVLKPLAAALADGDHVWAVIKGSAMNNDGARRVGFSAPGVDGQARVIRTALAAAGAPPESIGYLEAHGSGTPLGDRIELAALQQAFHSTLESAPRSGRFCALGSVKPNVGHLDAAAGVTSLIKAALALHHKTLPPSLGFVTPHPELARDDSPFRVVTGCEPWETVDGTLRRAGVNSFGMGGTNAHLILEEAPAPQPSGESNPWQVLPLSARTETALAAMAHRLADWLEAHPEAELADVAWTLQAGRRAFGHRRVVVCGEREEAVRGLRDPHPRPLSHAPSPRPGEGSPLPKQESSASLPLSCLPLSRAEGGCVGEGDRGGEGSAEPLPFPDREAHLVDLWLSGGDPDWNELHTGSRRRVPLPTYPFERQRYWIEAAGIDPQGVASVDGPRPAALPSAHARPAELSAGYEAPRDETERAVVAIWEEVFGIAPIGIRDSFSELGGHSLMATQIQSRVRDRFGVALHLAAVLKASTVAALAETIGQSVPAGDAAPSRPEERIAPRSAPADRFPVSFSQMRLWLLDRIEPGTPAYNIPVPLLLEGPLDCSLLERCLAETVRRHESLRTVFALDGKEPVQVILPPWELRVPLADLTALPATAREAESERLIDQETRIGFALERLPLLRATLVRQGAERHVLLLTIHHIVADGWSMSVWFRELAALYRAFAEGRPSPLPELTIQYPDFAVWQRERLAGERLEELLAYWRGQLANATPTLDLPADRPRPPILVNRGTHEHAVLDSSLSDGIRELARSVDATPFMVFLAAFQTLLFRYTGQEDVSTGTFIANRNRAEIENLIGFFVNTLVLHTGLGGAPTFRELVGRVREVTLGAYAHQDLPLERLLEAMQPKRDTSRTPLFQVMLVLQNLPEVARLPELTLSFLPQQLRRANFDLTLWLAPAGDAFTVDAEYATALFDTPTIRRLLGHFRELLTAAAAAPDTPLGRLPLMGEDERRQVLLEWNDTGAWLGTDIPVHLRIREQARRTPDAPAVAVVTGGHSVTALTYGELDRRAEELAVHLRGLGVGPERIVGLALRRSPEQIVGLLGILYAGAAYVPLDPEYPRERLELMLRHAAAEVVLADAASAERIPTAGLHLIRMDGPLPKAAGTALTALPRVDPAHPVYVIFTSGSTGVPKGVVVTHRGLANHTASVILDFELRPEDRWLQFFSISFDSSAEEIYPVLAAGATLVLRDDSMLTSAADFLRAVESLEITVLDVPTAFWHELAAGMERGKVPLPPRVRLVIVGGEKALADRMESWFRAGAGSARLVNTYGPTEVTIVATRRDLTAGMTEAPIGRPIHNLRASVIDPGLEPVPIGVPGELYLGGDGLARGYLGRPDLTAERFVPDPLSGEPGSRLYRTGDLVRWRPDQDLEFMGRVDRQVKIRGFRVEVGEVEKALRQHPGLADGLVETRQDAGGSHRLIGWVVSAGAAVLPEDLRAWLRERLPEYMVPSVFVALAELPLTPSGKIDRKALPEPERAGPEATYIPPRSELEQIIAGIWQEVLGVPRVGLHDNFFELGGHSLLVIQAHGRLREALQREIDVVMLFQRPTVSALAKELRQGEEKPVFAEARELVMRQGTVQDRRKQMMEQMMQQRRKR